MVQVNWERILSVKAAALSDQEIEDLCPMVISCDVEVVNDIDNLRTLMKLSQDMLQHKDNQVESLLLECNELKRRIADGKPTSTSKRKKSLARDLVDSNVRNDASLSARNIDTDERKNEKIATLVSELETLEDENLKLKKKLTAVKEEMQVATEHMNQMTEELSSLKEKSRTCKERLVEQEQKNKALLGQIEEISTQQSDRDKILDEFSSAIDARVTEWQIILDEKDVEINTLRENLAQATMHSANSFKNDDKSQILHLNQIIDQRDETIKKLQDNLSEAIDEMNESTSLIEKLKAENQKIENTNRRKEQRNILRSLHEAREKVDNLEKLLARTNSELEIKSRELCDALVDLKKYEGGEYGLAEATQELREARKQLQEKDKYVEELIDVVNKMDEVNSQQELKIVTLCEELKLPPDSLIPVDGIVARHATEMRTADGYRRENEALKKEIVELKSDVRTLKFRLKSLGEGLPARTRDDADAGTDPVPSEKVSSVEYDWITERETVAQRHTMEIEDIKDNVRIVVEENEALRRGMHEILDSIRDQDGNCSVEIQSETLEKLLEALDVRHLAGWYHPAMRLQSRLGAIQGSNAELRSQLKQLRSELRRKDEILQQIAMTNRLKKSISSSSEMEEESSSHPRGSASLRETYEIEKEDWRKERASLYEEKSELEDTVTRLEAKLAEYEGNWRILESGEDEGKRVFAERCRENAEIAVQRIILERKCKILEELLSKESSRVYNDQKRSIADEAERQRKLVDLDKRNKILLSRVATLESNLHNSVSLLEFEELRDNYNETRLRLRTTMEDKKLLDEGDETSNPEGERSLEDIGERLDPAYHHGQGDSEPPVRLIGKTATNQRRSNRGIVGSFDDKILERANELRKMIVECGRVPESVETFETKGRIDVLEAENESLRRDVRIAKEEAEAYAGQHFLKTFELESLRHQLLDLQSINEDKETIARLGFELTNCKLLEAETSREKVSLRTEIDQLRSENETLRHKYEESRALTSDCQKRCEARCRIYADVVDFLQRQYAAATPLTSLERYETALMKLKKDKLNVEEALKEALKGNENIQSQHDTLAGRLQVVEHLKAILEQQIGSPDVQDIIHRFSETSQSMLSELKYKRQITRLENELKIANERIFERDGVINTMEFEMVYIQKIWGYRSTREEDRKIEDDALPRGEMKINSASVSVQATVENRPIGVQSDPETKVFVNEENVAREEDRYVGKTSPREIRDRRIETDLRDKLSQALSLASERSSTLIKYESRIAEYEAKIVALNKLIEDKNEGEKNTRRANESIKPEASTGESDTSEKILMKSRINSLQKMLGQKEETIARYQNLLKEDRDEHSEAAARFQEEIKDLRTKLANAQEQVDRNLSEYIRSPGNRSMRREKSSDWNKNIDLEEEVEKLHEKVSTLEADLNITKELGERWRRLAEERLNHMDHMRQRLEEQHKSELESYRSERDKWQTEADILRQQLSDNRMKIAKGNSLLNKELQERENKIHELDMAYQQLQNELELVEKTNASQQFVASDSKIQEMAHHLGKVQSNQLQAQFDLTRRQLQALMEKEKTYKSQIVDLKQQLSRTYMATKTHDQKISQREAQLERKVRSLEDDLHSTKLELEREKFTNENKRVKIAEDLALWDKQKRWQQTAEKLKEKLKDKDEAYKKLQSNYEKLRGVVACMEREKWYLRSKLRCENGCLVGSLSARPRPVDGYEATEELQQECLALRERIRELVDRLETEDASELVAKVDEQRRRILALEGVAKGNEYVIEQIERLEATRDVLEKNNLRLEGENLELRLEIERLILETPRLREKVEHLEKYVELLKEEKSSESSPRSVDKESHDQGKKSTTELERTVFTLKRVVEKLQADNKRLRLNGKRNETNPRSARSNNIPTNASHLRVQYERAQQRVVALETDLQLAKQRIAMLESSRKEEDNNGEIGMLKHQLEHKSQLLDKVKQLLTRAAINEKAMRQKLQMLEAKQTLETIPECMVSPASSDE